MSTALNEVGVQNALATTVTAASLTLPTGVKPTHMLLYIAGVPIRWRASVAGTAPTATAGMYMAAGLYLDWTDPRRDYTGMIANFQIIRDTTAGANGTVDVTYFIGRD